MESVFTSTGGRPVVLDTSVSQPVSCFGLVMKSATVMSVSSRVPNIFPTPVTQVNQLMPSCDRNLPKHLNKEFDRRRPYDAPVVTSLPFSLFDYVGQYQTSFHVARFRRM